jgi:hypothetical protein
VNEARKKFAPRRRKFLGRFKGIGEDFMRAMRRSPKQS